jgi:hypothetical protein
VVKDDDLVLATHGRSFWILDDLSPLRQFTPQVPEEDVHLYTPDPALREHMPEEAPKSVLVGENPPAGAVIDFWLKSAPKGDTTIEILDESGNVIRRYSSARTEDLDEPLRPESKKPEKEIKPEAGLNRFQWDLRYEGTARIPDYYLWDYNDGMRGPLVVPGKYQVRLTTEGKSQTVPLAVKLDPRVKVDQADLQKQFDLLLKIRDELNRVNQTVNQIRDVRSQLDGLRKRLPDSDHTKTVMTAADGLDQKLLSLRDDMIQIKVKSNEDSLSYPQKIDAKWAFLSIVVGGDSDSAPTAADEQEFDKLKGQTDALLARWQDLQKSDLASFQKLMSEQKIQAIVVPMAGSPEVSAGEPK